MRFGVYFTRVLCLAICCISLTWTSLSAAQLSSTQGATIQAALDKAGVTGVKFDLNVRVPVPGAAGQPPVDLWATVISSAGGEPRL